MVTCMRDRDFRQDDDRVLEAMKQAGITPGELWLYYFHLGGDLGEVDVSAYFHGLTVLPKQDRVLLAHAFIELLCDPGRP